MAMPHSVYSGNYKQVGDQSSGGVFEWWRQVFVARTPMCLRLFYKKTGGFPGRSLMGYFRVRPFWHDRCS